MYIKQLYTGCLAQAAYYIESAGEAVIIDPLRETAPYIKLAHERGASIKYILETHFHADFVSGHVDLAQKTGATIVFGPTAKTSYKAHIAVDGEELSVGEIVLKVLHTPGHTMESTTYLLKDENGKDEAIFTGDTLFIGDVGRPDLAVKSELTKKDLASILYDSLHNKIMPLADDVIVYPAHGAGSACGKNMSKETSATLGNQKLFNYALQAASKAEFIAQVTDGIAAPPQYFPKNVAINKTGYESLDTIMAKGLRPLTADDVKAELEEDALILDTRSANDFTASHIKNSLFIGIDGSFASWAGTLLPDLTRRIILIADTGREEEVVTRLARVGYDNTVGYLQGGVDAWKEAGNSLATIEDILPDEFAKRLKTEKLEILDVRKSSEFDALHVVGAENFPLDTINEHFYELDKNKTYYLHCQGGYRSVIAASILQSIGYSNLINVDKGFKGIEQTDVPLTKEVLVG